MKGARIRPELAAGIVALALLAACAGPRGFERAPVSEAERRAYHAAKAQVESDPAAAERGFEEFLRVWPDSALAPRAEQRLGDIALERGEPERALGRFYRVVDRYPDAEGADVIRVRIAELELERGDPEAATKVLGRARLSQLSNENKRSAYRTLASAAPDPVAQLRWLARLRVIEPDEAAVAAIDVEIDAGIAQLDEANLDRAIDQIGREIPAARLQLRRATIALEAGDLEAAEKARKRASAMPQAPSTYRELQLLGERIEIRRALPGDVLRMPTFAEVMKRGLPKTAGAEGTLGVVLPLSGPFAGFGEESLQGILLAAGVFDELADERARPDVRLVVRDTGGRPERAAEAVRELTDDPNVTAIIGPLLKGECEAAAAAAEVAGVPLIALTARTEVAQGRPHVFRIRTQPDQEIEVLVDHAMNALGAQRFAILYPRDAYGRGLRGLFWDAVEERGGYVVGVAAYDPDATDFAEPIRRLVGFELLGEEAKTLIEEREEMRYRARRLPPDEALVLREEARALTTEEGDPLPPIVDFDALFIPESSEKVVLIAPQLAFHEAVGAQLLGASGWYDPDLVKIGRHHVSGALFTAHYYAESPLPFVKDFTERYTATFAEEPDALAAQAFDAANLVLVQLARGRDSREEVRDGVIAIRAYPGVSGVLSMSADGNAHKRPYLLGVERGRMNQID
jgi:ABC-type branched-subunit amino acid transport system substrate-binding protein